MVKYLPRFSKQFILQITLYLFVNALFILKYTPRVDFAPFVFLPIYVAIILTTYFLYKKYAEKLSQKVYKYLSWSLLGLFVVVITVALICIDPYSVRVDRWSAVSFFLDAFFHGDYPYAVHTHVSETNFPSPFPVWHFINLPFYLVGDVGIGLIFFIILTFVGVRMFFNSYQKSFFFLLLLFLSPAYWWEVAVRSDSLSNAFLVFFVILWFSKNKFTLEKNFWLSVTVCGLIAATRLSAILPVALFLFKPYIHLSWSKKIVFPLGILGLVLLVFLPFIFWDTTHWVFFSRNPFMSQTSIGNPLILLVMVAFGAMLALKWKDMEQYFNYTAIFLFVFILSSQIGLMFTRGINGSIFMDSTYDVSYFTLLLPYVIMSLAGFETNKTQLTSYSANS